MSVLLPVYNGMPLLPDAAESILQQTFQDFELLLVDDGSSDGSGEWCDALAGRAGRVRVLRHAGGAHRGLVASLNLGLAEARGELVARMDADDRSYPERLARQVAYLDDHPGIAVLGTATHVSDGCGGLTTWPSVETPALVRWRLRFGVTFTHPTVLMRRAAVLEAGGYTERALHNEDHDLWLRVAAKYDLANLPEPLLFFNTEGTSNVSTVYAGPQRAAGIGLALSVIRVIVPAATRDDVADACDVVYARPLEPRPNHPLPERLDRVARLMTSLCRETCRCRPADAREVREQVALQLDRLKWQLRMTGVGRTTALLRHARWSPSLFASSVAYRVRRPLFGL